VRNDVDLVDVIEYLVDGVMAGMGRTGAYTYQELP
jgi:adenosylmethionine-8-amino-7-oxononanoate aminotransferase